MESGLQIAKSNEIVDKSSQVVLHKNIPEDLVDEILSRLPVKSLFRFKAVSKLWHSTISNPTFCRRCPAATSAFIIAYKILLYDRNLYELFTTDGKSSYRKFPIPACCEEYKHLREKLSNSCNGMLLLSLGPHIFLINPCTRYFEKVLQLDDLSKLDSSLTIGFCYDESVSDYKAVIILSTYTVNRSLLVASLKEKRWTRLSLPEDFGSFIDGPVLVNDRLHWIVNKTYYVSFGNEISYFNPLKNVFGKLLCPQPNTNVILGIGVFEGCLYIVRDTYMNDSEKGTEIMIMKEYGVAESWTRLFVIHNVDLFYTCRLKLLFKTEDGNILIATKCNLWRYNPANNCCTKLDRHYNSFWHYIDVVTIEDNLNLPAPPGI